MKRLISLASTFILFFAALQFTESRRAENLGASKSSDRLLDLVRIFGQHGSKPNSPHQLNDHNANPGEIISWRSSFVQKESCVNSCRQNLPRCLTHRTDTKNDCTVQGALKSTIGYPTKKYCQCTCTSY